MMMYASVDTIYGALVCWFVEPVIRCSEWKLPIRLGAVITDSGYDYMDLPRNK